MYYTFSIYLLIYLNTHKWQWPATKCASTY